jgi:hypothetical protein
VGQATCVLERASRVVDAAGAEDDEEAGRGRDVVQDVADLIARFLDEAACLVILRCG